MIQFQRTTLPNGLTLLAEADGDAHTASLGFFVRTGARDESPDVMGVSHFLEHMMFKGTARRSADDVNREFDELGANYNAFTSHEQTVYYAQVLPEYLPAAADLLGDMLRPALREEDFIMEKNVILEEIGMYDDRPEWRLQDTLLETYFNGHPLGHRVLGTKETVGGLTASQMREYFSQRYSPDNIIVAAAGQVDFDALVSQLEQLTEAWQPTDAARKHGKPPARGHRRAACRRPCHPPLPRHARPRALRSGPPAVRGESIVGYSGRQRRVPALLGPGRPRPGGGGGLQLDATGRQRCVVRLRRLHAGPR